MGTATTKISGRKLLAVLFVIIVAVFAATAALALGFSTAKYVVFLLVPVGALLTIFGAVGVMTERVERDF